MPPRRGAANAYAAICASRALRGSASQAQGPVPLFLAKRIDPGASRAAGNPGSRRDLRRVERRDRNSPRRSDRSFHELINYVEHYGLVRVENSPIMPHHSWDCYRTLSNVLHYNLPRHADHHMFASKAFWQLNAQQDAPTLPYGYQTMAFIALPPPLWRHIMRKLLADWDERFASEAERKAVRERGWEGVA